MNPPRRATDQIVSIYANRRFTFMKSAALAFAVMFLAPNVYASDACEWNAGFVTEKSRRVTPTEVAALTKSANARDIIAKLGPAARDVGFGLYVLQWDMSDGRIFSVSTAGACQTPIAAGIKERGQGNEKPAAK